MYGSGQPYIHTKPYPQALDAAITANGAASTIEPRLQASLLLSLSTLGML